MKNRHFRRILVTILAIPLLAIASLLVLAMFSGGSAGGTLHSGRSVMTYSDAMTLKSQFTSDTATIETAGQRIVVKPTSLIVNGRTVAEIDRNVSDVKVHVKSGVIRFVADGHPVTVTR